MLPKISILIPAYNSEKYIGKCLTSAINQSCRDIEIICIDDCSKDKTFKIMKEFAKKDKRIQIYRNGTNKGIAHNRNQLINLARGDYFSFLDSDDWLAKNACKNFVKAARGKVYDIACSRTRVVFESKKWFRPTFFPRTFGKKTTAIQYVEKNIPLCWASFINRSYYNSLKACFNDKTSEIFEDLGLMPYVYLNAKRFLPITKHCYYYFRRKGSTSRLEDENLFRLQEIVKQIDYLLGLFKKNGMLYEPKYRKAIEASLYTPTGFIYFFKTPKGKNNKLVYEKIKQEVAYVVVKKYGLTLFKFTTASSWWKRILSVMFKVSYRKQMGSVKN